MELAGSCRCGAVSFTCKSHTPVPYLRCYCTICSKLSGCGYTICLAAVADSLKVQGRDSLKPYRVMLPGPSGALQPSTSSRFFCTRCGCHLWAEDPSWSPWIWAFAGAIDTELPKPPCSVHIMLKYKAAWVEPQIAAGDERFDEFPPQLEAGADDAWGVEEWHRKHGLLVE